MLDLDEGYQRRLAAVCLHQFGNTGGGGVLLSRDMKVVEGPSIAVFVFLLTI